MILALLAGLRDHPIRHLYQIIAKYHSEQLCGQPDYP